MYKHDVFHSVHLHLWERAMRLSLPGLGQEQFVQIVRTVGEMEIFSSKLTGLPVDASEVLWASLG